MTTCWNIVKKISLFLARECLQLCFWRFIKCCKIHKNYFVCNLINKSEKIQCLYHVTDEIFRKRSSYSATYKLFRFWHTIRFCLNEIVTDTFFCLSGKFWKIKTGDVYNDSFRYDVNLRIIISMTKVFCLNFSLKHLRIACLLSWFIHFSR